MHVKKYMKYQVKMDSKCFVHNNNLYNMIDSLPYIGFLIEHLIWYICNHLYSQIYPKKQVTHGYINCGNEKHN